MDSELEAERRFQGTPARMVVRPPQVWRSRPNVRGRCGADDRRPGQGFGRTRPALADEPGERWSASAWGTVVLHGSPSGMGGDGASSRDRRASRATLPPGRSPFFEPGSPAMSWRKRRPRRSVLGAPDWRSRAGPLRAKEPMGALRSKEGDAQKNREKRAAERWGPGPAPEGCVLAAGGAYGRGRKADRPAWPPWFPGSATRGCKYPSKASTSSGRTRPAPGARVPGGWVGGGHEGRRGSSWRDGKITRPPADGHRRLRRIMATAAADLMVRDAR